MGGESSEPAVPGTVEILSTSAAAPNQRLDVWREQVQLTCGALQVMAKNDEFCGGTIRTRRFGDTQVSLISADPHTVIRSNRITGTTDGYLYVCRPHSGTAWVTQDGKQTAVQAGDIVCFDNLRPYTLAMPEPFTMVSMRFPHEVVGIRPGSTRGLTADPWSGGRGVGALVGHLLAGLGEQLGELEGAASNPVGSSISCLIGALFAERLRQSAHDPLIARQVLLMRVQAFCLENLGDPELTPATLARRHNISVRYLQQLFAEEGTSPARWIREKRLARCHADLCDPHNGRLTVAAIGERWGLPDPSHVSRLFREQYGMTPREFRKLRRHAVA
jgi:AraC-like DNA-binding protein